MASRMHVPPWSASSAGFVAEFEMRPVAAAAFPRGFVHSSIFTGLPSGSASAACSSTTRVCANRPVTQQWSVSRGAALLVAAGLGRGAFMSRRRRHSHAVLLRAVVSADVAESESSERTGLSWEDLKRQTFMDASVVAALGSLLGFANNGVDSSIGFALGSLTGLLYLLLLQLDVDALGTSGGGTPLDMFRWQRLARFLLPVLLVFALAAQAVSTVGVDAWLENVRWVPGANFVGVASSPQAVYGAALGYVLTTLTLRLRNLFGALPELSGLLKGTLPGSMGTAARLAEDMKKKAKNAKPVVAEDVTPVPVLIVSGPRGSGKSTLVERLRQADKHFFEPEWVATDGAGTLSEGKRRISSDDFTRMDKEGSLAVSFRPYDDDGEQVGVGLPATAILEAAARSRNGAGACVLEADAPTARAFLSYDWDAALADTARQLGISGRLELRPVCVWVCLPSLDAVLARNRQRILASSASTPQVETIERQLEPLRAQAATDTEWYATSGAFDFTVINEDVDKAAAELIKAAKYCYEDPF